MDKQNLSWALLSKELMISFRKDGRSFKERNKASVDIWPIPGRQPSLSRPLFLLQ